MSNAVEVVEHDHGRLRQELAEAGLPALPPGVLVYAIEGPFFFGSVDSLERALSWSHGQMPRAVILRLDRVPLVDATGIQRLESSLTALRRRGIRVVLTGAPMRVLRKLVRAGIVRHDGGGMADYHGDFIAAVRHLQDADASPVKESAATA